MNSRAITPIIEQFFIFAMGVFLFSIVVVAFRGMEADYLDKTGELSAQLAAEYTSFSIMNVYELKNTGRNPSVYTTVTIPNSKYFLEVKGSNVTAAAGSKTATVRLPVKIAAKGNAYTIEPINLKYQAGNISLKGGTPEEQTD